MLQRFLLLWLVLSSLLAYFWPVLWKGIAGVSSTWDPFLETKALLFYLIQLTMFSVGSLLPKEEVELVFRRWPTVFGGTAIQYLTMPALAFCIGNLFQLDSASMIGIMMVGCVPGAMASNVLTLAARGNVSYSISLTTAATLLSPLAVPLAMWLTLGTTIKQDPLKVSWDLLLTVVFPVLTGHLLTRYVEKFRQVMQVAGPLLANLSILWIIAVVVGINRERLEEISMLMLCALLLLNLLGYLAGYAGGRWVLKLPEPMCRAITLEVGMQNAGLGTVLTLQYFASDKMAVIPTAAYTFGCMLTGTILAQIWRSRPPTEADRCFKEC